MGLPSLSLVCLLFLNLHLSSASTCLGRDSVVTGGVVTSLNYPDNYPHNFRDTSTINAIDNCVLKLGFSHFAVFTNRKCGDCEDLEAPWCKWSSRNYTASCLCDYLEITDGSETTLMDRSCGYNNVDKYSPLLFEPPMITSNSSITISFKTSGNGTTGRRGGWRALWSAVTPECSLASPGSPCDSIGEKNCPYQIKDQCCCGRCSEWEKLECVSDSSSGRGVWEVASICPAGGCGTEGVLSSPNYPDMFPKKPRQDRGN